MKKIIIAASAAALLASASIASFAADLPVKAPPLPVSPEFSWAGFYIGANAGYDWGKTTVDYIPPGGPNGFIPIDVLVYGAGASQHFHTGGFTGGGQAGYNYQVQRLVLGVEGDFDFLSRHGSFTGRVPVPPGVWGVQNVNLSGHDGWLATIRGRLGFTYNQALFYVTGGVAFTDAGVNIGNNWNPAISFRDASTIFTSTQTGWAAGAGVEYALQNNWSIKAEYLRLQFEGFTAVSTLGMLNPGVNVFHQYNVTFVDNILQVGVNYKFGGPIVARY